MGGTQPESAAVSGIGVQPYRGWLRCDPRTKITLVFTVGCFCVTLMGGDSPSVYVMRLLLSLTPIPLLLLTRHIGAGIGYALCVVGFTALARFALPLLTGEVSWLLYASIGMMTQILPGAMIAYWMLATTTASELIAALQRMHVPLAITVPIAVMFRFFPVVVDEQRSINDAMRMRGVRFGGGKMSQMLEYRVVPLMTNSVRIADELTQSALTRGLGYADRRTSIARVGFRLTDAVLLALCVACFAVWGLSVVGVLP